jgi:hypothetical protein
MPDPNAYDLLGVKCASLIAGVAGALTNLYFSPPKTLPQLIAGVGVGVATAIYLTPLLVEYGVFSGAVENGVAFVAGLTAMNLVPVIIKQSQAIVSDPVAFLRRWKSSGGE